MGAPELPNFTFGAKTWVIADGYIPPTSMGPEPAMTSHDSFCMLNATGVAAEVEVWVFFTDRDPVGPYGLTIEPRRAYHQRVNNLEGPESIELGMDYSLVIRSTAPIVVQHTRLDSRQSENAVMTTIAYPVG